MTLEPVRRPEIAPLTLEELRPKGDGAFHVLANVQLSSAWNVLSDCAIAELEPGQTLLRRGERNATLFMVLSGKLDVHLESVEDKPVACLEVGQTVGELSVIDGSPASATVVASERTRLLELDKDAFFGLVRTSHAFAVNVMLLLAERVRSNNFSLTRAVQLQRQFLQEALTDGLTGLHNRRWLQETLPRLVGRYDRDKRPLSVMMLDVDHFKRINDTHGHAVGDQVLRLVADTLQSTLRPLDLSARYGGEEFAVIMPETDIFGALAAAERLRCNIERQRLTLDEQRQVSLTVSIGVTQAQKDRDAAALIEEADAALYRAKHLGRNRVVASRVE